LPSKEYPTTNEEATPNGLMETENIIGIGTQVWRHLLLMETCS
jgi:hypothetical protein